MRPPELGASSKYCKNFREIFVDSSSMYPPWPAPVCRHCRRRGPVLVLLHIIVWFPRPVVGYFSDQMLNCNQVLSPQWILSGSFKWHLIRMHTDYKQIPMCPGTGQEIPVSVGRIIWSNTSISVNYGLAAAAVATGAACKYHPLIPTVHCHGVSIIHRALHCLQQGWGCTDCKDVFSLELSTNIRQVSECPEKACPQQS